MQRFFDGLHFCLRLCVKTIAVFFERGDLQRRDFRGRADWLRACLKTGHADALAGKIIWRRCWVCCYCLNSNCTQRLAICPFTLRASPYRVFKHALAGMGERAPETIPPLCTHTARPCLRWNSGGTMGDLCCHKRSGGGNPGPPRSTKSSSGADNRTRNWRVSVLTFF